MTLLASGADPDLWGHLRFGLDWWESFTLPLADPYSFTQDRPWINHEWLSEAAMGAAYRAVGATGLILLKVATIGAALGILYHRLRGATPVVTTIVLSLAIVTVLPISLTIRPQLWSVLCLAALAALLDNPASPPPFRIVACALLFTLWANLHGGWVTGAGVLAAYCGVRLVQAPGQALRWSAMIGVPLLATLVNPYGIGLWRFLASTVRASRPDITEWQPMGIDSPLILWVPLAATIAISAALSRERETRPSLPVLAALLLLVLAAIRVHRVAPLMGPASLVFLAPYISRAWGHAGRVRLPDRRAAQILWIPAAVALLAVARPATAFLACLTIRGDWAPDTVAAMALKGRQGKLATTFVWGEYAIWHFGPALRVSVDGRRETVYSDSVIQLHRRFEAGEPDALEDVRKLAPDYIWLPASRTRVKDWLRDNDYRIDITTPASFIAVRHDIPPLHMSGAAPSRCFP